MKIKLSYSNTPREVAEVVFYRGLNWGWAKTAEGLAICTVDRELRAFYGNKVIDAELKPLTKEVEYTNC